MIREAILSDIPKLVEQGHRFVDDLPFDVESDEGSIQKVLTNLINDDSAIVFVSDDGLSAIGGLAFPFFFNNNILTGQELFWWVNESDRKGRIGITLINALEDWAKNKGVEYFSMTSLDNEMKDKLSSFYERKGYIKNEQSFVRKM